LSRKNKRGEYNCTQERRNMRFKTAEKEESNHDTEKQDTRGAMQDKTRWQPEEVGIQQLQDGNKRQEPGREQSETSGRYITWNNSHGRGGHIIQREETRVEIIWTQAGDESQEMEIQYKEYNTRRQLTKEMGYNLRGLKPCKRWTHSATLGIYGM
jgi:hypothetical protein